MNVHSGGWEETRKEFVRATDVRLVDAYAVPEAPEILYELLKEREPWQNISHKELPAYADHLKFFNSKPYLCWYLIEYLGQYIGHIYINHNRESGRFLFRKFRGLGAHLAHDALVELRARHPGKLYANIAPGNRIAQKMVNWEGFRLIQCTYFLDEDEPLLP